MSGAEKKVQKRPIWMWVINFQQKVQRQFNTCREVAVSSRNGAKIIIVCPYRKNELGFMSHSTIKI
jgi:hypothetical protein